MIGAVSALAAAAVTAALAAVASRTGAHAFADWLDVGTPGDRLAFVADMEGLGAAAGACIGSWLALRRLTRPVSLPRLMSGTLAALATFAVAMGYFAFAVTMPPPPVQPYLVTQLRLAGHRWTDLVVTASANRMEIRPRILELAAQADGSTLVDVLLPVPEQSGVRAIILQRDQREIARFSLDLPGDPPETANYSHWLTPDRGDGEAVAAQMRFRIARRMAR